MTAAKPISREEFLATFHVGDEFWYMGSCFSEPSEPTGPHPISYIGRDTEHHTIKIIVKYRFESGDPGWDYLDDLTNESHGVFRSREDAMGYFEERRHALANDPEWQKRVARDKVSCHRFLNSRKSF